jgi:hypothetical protein
MSSLPLELVQPLLQLFQDEVHDEFESLQLVGSKFLVTIMKGRSDKSPTTPRSATYVLPTIVM